MGGWRLTCCVSRDLKRRISLTASSKLFRWTSDFGWTTCNANDIIFQWLNNKQATKYQILAFWCHAVMPNEDFPNDAFSKMNFFPEKVQLIYCQFCFTNRLCTNSVHVKLGLPQAAQLSIFLKKNQLCFTSLKDLSKDILLTERDREIEEKEADHLPRIEPSTSRS